MSEDVLVVGGGVIGLSIAESLATDRVHVRVLEGESPGAGASGAAAGMLAPIAEAQAEGPLLRLGLESLSRFEALCSRLTEETGIDPELERSGLLRVALDATERDDLAARFGRLRDAMSAGRGETLEWLDVRELAHEVPGLSSEVEGAWRSLLECHLKPPLLVRALARAAISRGVEIESGVRVHRISRSGTRAQGLETSAGTRSAGHVILAAGPWTPGLLAASGIEWATADGPRIEPVRGQILNLEAPLPAVREIVWAEGVYLVPKRDGSWVVGATEERVGFDCRVTADGIATLLARARRVFPALADATFGRAWAGLRPVSCDRVPWLGPVPEVAGLSIAAGHGRNGVLLSPLTAERMRDEVLGKRAHDPADLCSPFRNFTARDAFD